MFSMPGRIDRDKLVNAANDGNEMKVRELLGASFCQPAPAVVA